MRPFLFLLLILTLAIVACGGAAPTVPSTPKPVSTSQATSTPKPALPTSTPTMESTATATAIPAGIIHVDTLDQEVYPFVSNGQCSLAEAMIAANSRKAVDTCAAGIEGETIIELMPGEYHFTQPDNSPPLFDWLISLRSVGSALPPVIFPLTIRGNSAILIRDEDSEPFRFFELMVNSKLTLEDVTLQGGEVGEDWGGAIYAMSALLNLDHVRLINNRAQLGGAIYFDLSALNIQNSEFKNNFSTNSGGALSISSSKANIQTTRFDSNQSDSDGAGLYAYWVTLTLTDNIFIKNRVTGDGYGSVGGGIYANHVNITITDSQFYQNESPMYGGAIAINNPELAGIDPEEGDIIEQIQSSPMISDMLTSIPGFQATLEAHPSGVYVDFHEDTQIHNNCFANNVTINPQDPNWTSGLLGRAAAADGNYWGDPSGPSGMGPGNGDSVGKRVIFAPFLTEMPEYCDTELAKKK